MTAHGKCVSNVTEHLSRSGVEVIGQMSELQGTPAPGLSAKWGLRSGHSGLDLLTLSSSHFDATRAGVPNYGSLKAYHDTVDRDDEPWSLDRLLSTVKVNQLGYRDWVRQSLVPSPHWAGSVSLTGPPDRRLGFDFPVSDAWPSLSNLGDHLRSLHLSLIYRRAASVRLSNARMNQASLVTKRQRIGPVMLRSVGSLSRVPMRQQAFAACMSSLILMAGI
jgi:hypothetical protein